MRNQVKLNEEADKRLRVHSQVLPNGILAIYFEKHNKEEEPFLQPSFKYSKENRTALLEKLQIHVSSGPAGLKE
jgi:hypothetical protein